MVEKKLLKNILGSKNFVSWNLLDQIFFLGWTKFFGQKNVQVKIFFDQIDIFDWKMCLGWNKMLGQNFYGIANFWVEKFFDPRSGNMWNNMEGLFPPRKL